jgi:hypothetical protein
MVAVAVAVHLLSVLPEQVQPTVMVVQALQVLFLEHLLHIRVAGVLEVITQ